MRLFCFPFVGGSGSFFNGLAPYLRPDIEPVKLEYAGHMERRHEPFYKDFDELTADMYGQIKTQAGEGPYALFGYSLGALAAAEVTKMIQARGEMPLPVHVFLASHGPCFLGERVSAEGPDENETIKRWTVRFGGLPEKLINSPTFWRVYLPVYRADYELITSYDFGRLVYETRIPATVFFSPSDIPRRDMEKWRRVFTGSCDILEYDGGHFFLREHEQEVADVINERLREHDI